MSSPPPSPDPYAPPRPAAKASRLPSAEFEESVVRSLRLLERGKGQTAVINELRGLGMPHETAKQESVAVFDEARRRLRRSQRGRRLVAWSLVGLGVLLPPLMFFSGIGYAIVSAAPMLLGMMILHRLPDPKPLAIG